MKHTNFKVTKANELVCYSILLIANKRTVY